MFKHSTVQLMAVAVAMMAIAACSKETDKKNRAPAAPSAPVAKAEYSGPTPVDKLRAKKLFDERCVTCHGASGHGDGPGAAALNPKPRNYTDVEWQKAITDEQLAAVIVKGGAATGKSLVMPGNPDLAVPEKRGVVDALVLMIRDFGKQGAPAEPTAATGAPAAPQ